MRRTVLFAVCLLGALPFVASAQQANTNATSSASLNETQTLGRRIFQQRCAVCHTQSTPGARRYGPVIYKDLVDGNEDAIREFIRNGSTGKMPGFKYGLEPAEIDAIVEYFKTVPRPPRPPRAGGGQENAVD